MYAANPSTHKRGAHSHAAVRSTLSATKTVQQCRTPKGTEKVKAGTKDEGNRFRRATHTHTHTLHHFTYANTHTHERCAIRQYFLSLAHALRNHSVSRQSLLFFFTLAASSVLHLHHCQCTARGKEEQELRGKHHGHFLKKEGVLCPSHPSRFFFFFLHDDVVANPHRRRCKTHTRQPLH